MKYFILSIVLCLCFFLPSCGDDYFETGIEGKWQLTKVVDNQGVETRVDTLFYSFKKGAFQYLRLNSDISSSYSYGLYFERNDSLIIQNVLEYGDFILEHWNGEASRGFKINKKTSSKMELDYKDNVYFLRKY